LLSLLDSADGRLGWATLIVVIAAVAVMTIFGLSQTGIKIVGDLPSGLPDITLPTIQASDISALIPGGAGVLRARLW
jgi:MFS superfamily sulfate permease-like transporter